MGNLYKEAEALCEEVKRSAYFGPAEKKSLKKFLKEFFENPTQVEGFSSSVIFKKVNYVFERYGDGRCYNDFVPQCHIDYFFATLIEKYDLNMVEEILGSTNKLNLSDETKKLLDEGWKTVKEISIQAAEYLQKRHVNLDKMSEMTVGLDQTVQSKFIDDLDIQKPDGIWTRIWIKADKNGEVTVTLIIVPQEAGGNAMYFDITPACKEWIETLV